MTLTGKRLDIYKQVSTVGQHVYVTLLSTKLVGCSACWFLYIRIFARHVFVVLDDVCLYSRMIRLHSGIHAAVLFAKQRAYFLPC